MAKIGKPRGVVRYTLSGLFIQRYPSVSAASRETGVSAYQISSACEDSSKVVGGFKWKYSSYGKLKTTAERTKDEVTATSERRIR